MSILSRPLLLISLIALTSHAAQTNIGRVNNALACKLLEASYCAYDVTSVTNLHGQAVELKTCVKQIKHLNYADQPIGFVDRSGLHAFLLGITQTGEVILSFRGTLPLGESNRLAPLDWINSLQFTRVNDKDLGSVHFGFHNALFDKFTSPSMWDALWPIVMNWKAQGKINENNFYITGHSKGGALAQIAALKLVLDTNVSATAVYTFEAPRVGTESFRDSYSKTNIATFRYENRIDVVPHLPPDYGEIGNALALFDPLSQPSAAPYVSVGTQRFINSQGELEVNPSQFTEKWVLDFKQKMNNKELGMARLASNHEIFPEPLTDSPSYYSVICGAH